MSINSITQAGEVFNPKKFELSHLDKIESATNRIDYAQATKQRFLEATKGLLKNNKVTTSSEQKEYISITGDNSYEIIQGNDNVRWTISVDPKTSLITISMDNGNFQGCDPYGKFQGKLVFQRKNNTVELFIQTPAKTLVPLDKSFYKCRDNSSNEF